MTFSVSAKATTKGCGGNTMDAAFFWSLFLDTGAPEAYLLYQREKQRNASAMKDVFEN